MPQVELDDALGTMRVWDRPSAGIHPMRIYTFKHALVQDAVDDTSLEAVAELHARSPCNRGVFLEHQGHRTRGAVALLHRCGSHRSSHSLWQAARELGLQRVAWTEAISISIRDSN